MKLKFFAFLAISLICFQTSRAQYKDLEGVFFGKVVAIGVGGTAHVYKEPLGTKFSVTPLTYSVILNSKSFASFKFALHPQLEEANKFIELGIDYKFALTKDGFEKPTSLFLNFQVGVLLTKNKDNSAFGESLPGAFYGAGLSIFQRVGSRFVLFAEPGYRLSRGDGDIKLSNPNCHIGAMFLIGKSR